MNDETYSQSGMFSGVSSGSLFVNPRCVIYEEESMCVCMLDGIPIALYHKDDRFARDLFIAQAQEAGFAKGEELARALGLGLRTVYRIRQRYRDGGALGLEHKRPGPKGPRLGQAREAAIVRWHHDGRTVYWMAKRLKISMDTVRRVLIRRGLPTRRVTATQPSLLEERTGDSRREDVTAERGVDESRGDGDDALPVGRARPSASEVSATAGSRGDGYASSEGEELGSAPAVGAVGQLGVRERQAVCVNTERLRDMVVVDPADRGVDRLLASMGLLDDAPPVFAAGQNVPRAGVLLAMPALVQSGVFEVAEEIYGSIGPAFYGLRTILVTMVLMALLRIKHPENVKEVAPYELGRVLGLDRAPEVKTIRRKLRRLAADPTTSERFLAAMACRRATRAQEAMGFLYVDGHMRVYHGQADIPKTHVARIRLSVPATQDVWINDGNGDPVFVVTQSPHRQLVSALPEVLADVRRLIGDRRVTVVFDRGGWSPALFQRMDADGFDVLTYRKGRSEEISPEDFGLHQVMLPTGVVTYELSDRPVLVGNGFTMRQVTRRQDDHQTHVITTRTDLPAGEVARRMFDRWRQENFFKYMREQFAIDALVEYGTEHDDPDRKVPNPRRQDADKALAKAKSHLFDIENEYAMACAAGPERETVRIAGMTPIYGMRLLQPRDDARRRVRELEERRNAIPNRVRVGDIKDHVVRLRRQRKRISDAFKMLAYQAETDLTRAVAPHFARSLDEGRTLIRAALQSAADLEPVDGELRVTLAPQSTRSRTIALAAVCSELNDSRTLYPGTKLRLRYAVRGVEPAT